MRFTLPEHLSSPRVLVGLVLLYLNFYVQCFVDHSLSLFFTIALYVLRFMSSDYLFDIFQLFLHRLSILRYPVDIKNNYEKSDQMKSDYTSGIRQQWPKSQCSVICDTRIKPVHSKDSNEGYVIVELKLPKIFFQMHFSLTHRGR